MYIKINIKQKIFKFNKKNLVMIKINYNVSHCLARLKTTLRSYKA